MTQNETKNLLARFAAWNLMLLLSLILHLESPFASNITYAYDGAGRLTKVDYGNGTSIQYTYDKAGNLLSSVVSGGGPPPVTMYDLTITKAGTDSGTVTSSPSGINCGSICSASFKSGASVTLKAKADPGSTFKGWSGACTGTSCKVKMGSNLTVTATFVLPDLRGEWSGVAVKQTKTNYEVSGKLTVFSDEGKAASVSAKVYLSDDNIYDQSDSLLGTVSIGTINANSSKAKALKYKVTANPSGKYLIAVIDPDSKVPESNKDNNVPVIQIQP